MRAEERYLSGEDHLQSAAYRSSQSPPELYQIRTYEVYTRRRTNITHGLRINSAELDYTKLCTENLLMRQGNHRIYPGSPIGRNIACSCCCSPKYHCK